MPAGEAIAAGLEARDDKISAFPGMSAAAVSSEELARRAQGGCAASFDELVRRHGGPLEDFLRRRFGVGDEASDVAQETWLRAHRHLARYRHEFSFSTWLYTIGARLSCSRHRQRPQEVALPEIEGEWAHACAATAGDEVAAREEAGNLWQTARRVLRERDYEVLWMRYGVDMTVLDIAGATGRSAIHVRVMLHRVRGRLARELKRVGRVGL